MDNFYFLTYVNIKIEMKNNDRFCVCVCVADQKKLFLDQKKILAGTLASKKKTPT